ncbi:MAG TPA: choice-of-anchor D domain-containing protein [Myxococcales bacterium]|jgi:hypothetical protein
MRRLALLCSLVLLAAACQEEKVESVPPQIRIESRVVEFGIVRVGTPADGVVKITAESRSPLTIVSLVVTDDPAAPGGAKAFSVPKALQSVDGNSEVALAVRFAPPAVGDFKAILTVESDDPDPADAALQIALTGRGGVPKISLVPTCAAPCEKFEVGAEPPAIDFGARNALRTDSTGRIINEPVWPTLTLSNTGEIPLTLSRAAFEGSEGFSSKQSLNAAGVVVEAGKSLLFQLVFDPRDESPEPYVADLVVESDDPATAVAKLHLTGTLAPNQPPVACASIVEVLQPDGAVDLPRDASGAPAFGGQVQVQPGDRGLVKLSAFSDHFTEGLHPNESAKGDLSQCTTDPEDGRQVLVYQWAMLEKPATSAAEIYSPTSPEPSLRVDAIGRYKVGLTVTDPRGKTASAEVSLEALPQRDLAVELSWEKQPSVDLDVHLVKPGPCGADPSCLFSRLGDASGYTSGKTGGVFDWGEAGAAYDNPRLDIDDQGDKSLIENVNLNRPENDPACATAECTYDVYVHYFKDWRSGSPTAPACPGKPCKEGDECGCGATAAGAGSLCVSARCVAPVSAKVKVFVRPTPDHPEPAMVVPVDPEIVQLAGPCFVWHVARVTWPSKAALQADPNAMVSVSSPGNPGARQFVYFGKLDPKSFACAPNTPAGTPEADVTYVPGTVPEYP